MPQAAETYPFIAYTIVAVAIVLGLLVAAWWLGAKSSNSNKGLPYESGVIPTGSARLPLQVPFYLVAIVFIVFDVETAFIFIWALVWDRLGMAGLLHITFFILALLFGLSWLWLKGGLDWGPSRAERTSEAGGKP